MTDAASSNRCAVLARPTCLTIALTSLALHAIKCILRTAEGCDPSFFETCMCLHNRWVEFVPWAHSRICSSTDHNGRASSSAAAATCCRQPPFLFRVVGGVSLWTSPGQIRAPSVLLAPLCHPRSCMFVPTSLCLIEGCVGRALHISWMCWVTSAPAIS